MSKIVAFGVYDLLNQLYPRATQIERRRLLENLEKYTEGRGDVDDRGAVPRIADSPAQRSTGVLEPQKSRYGRVRVPNHRRVSGATTGSLCPLWLKSENRK